LLKATLNIAREGKDSMQIRDVMTETAETIASNASAIEAAAKMKELNVGALPVCDNGNLEGLITDRDIIMRLISERRDPLHTRIGEIMAGATYCFDDQTLDEAAALMETQQIGCMPILNRNKKLVGMLSLGDIAIRADTIYQDIANDALKHFRTFRAIK
jgi:CBS domain-containing protein